MLVVFVVCRKRARSEEDDDDDQSLPISKRINLLQIGYSAEEQHRILGASVMPQCQVLAGRKKFA